MEWEEYEKKGLIRKATLDEGLIRSLLKMSNEHLGFVKKQHIDDKNSSIILVLYYEALREVCEALAALNGLKIYSHEAITHLLSLKFGEEEASMIFDRYRKLRNGINYYGQGVSSKETSRSSVEILDLIAKLRKKYLKAFEEND
jgi:hypothetical protein